MQFSKKGASRNHAMRRADVRVPVGDGPRGVVIFWVIVVKEGDTLLSLPLDIIIYKGGYHAAINIQNR